MALTTITLSAQTSPAPHVEVIAEDFGGASTVTLWRTAGRRQFRVRGAVRVSAAGTVSVQDFEAPLGVESSYRAELFDGNGDRIEYSDVETVTLPAPAHPFLAWWHNPLEPENSVLVEMRGSATRTLQRPVDVEVLRVRGRSVGVAMFSNARSGMERIVLDCVTMTTSDRDRFDTLFGEYDDPTTIAIVCVRAHPAAELPPTLFAVVGAPSRLIYDGANVGELAYWSATGSEVAPPPEALVMSLLGYDDFTAFYDDYAAFTAAYADYREAQVDYSIAGTA